MDSKTVNRLIRELVRPLLKEKGFVTFTARSYWRHKPDRIEVINFQSWNWYNAEVMHITTYSFAVNLGIYFLAIPGYLQFIKEKDGRLLPAEYQCHFRYRPNKALVQPECRYPDLWYIDPEGEYLGPAVKDARDAIMGDGLAWFDRLSDKTAVLRILLEDEEVSPGVGWGFGRRPSPKRSLLTGYIALDLGERALALAALREAFASGCFGHMTDRLQADIRLLDSASD